MWQEINSAVEGNYMERFWRGAFRDTIKQSRKGMRVLFNHERDLIGLKLLGVIEGSRKIVGGRYVVRLLNTSYTRDLEPGLRAEVFGASFRFRVTHDELVESPPKSKHSPKQLPERTVLSCAVSDSGHLSRRQPPARRRPRPDRTRRQGGDGGAVRPLRCQADRRGLGCGTSARDGPR